ncbi:MAG: HAMP domain-containing sensor histidine kinase [Bacteroidales bacterium]|nr:HAMP domain-containing sensor histidine kinase [Bacteroidales bacterium]
MNIYSKKQTWKIALLVFAILIGVASFFITNNLVKKLSVEERKKVELWALGTRQLSGVESDETDYSFIIEVLKNNETVPVILTDKDGNIISSRNLDPKRENDSVYLKKQLLKMKSANEPFVINLLDGDKNLIYFKESTLLTQLFYFPLIQLGVIVLFLFVSYIAFSTSRKAEQNQVWVGMSKETAHQLGTPTSSLLANLELLRLKNVDETLISELEKDIHRLEKITDRFSKIGSAPKLKNENIIKILIDAVNYVKVRSSEKIVIKSNFSENDQFLVPLNVHLFEWVIENICKNAIDSMGGTGNISINLKDQVQHLIIDITDEGKGIPKSKFKTIFQPGYTTKQRGWGLGLSLSKRIIESYHKGRIFVFHSEVNKGTTMRIILKKA